MFCPYCETALRGPDGTTVDVLIRGDSRRTGVGVIFLAVLGGIGLALALVSAAREAVGGNARPLVAVLIIFAVFFVATALLALSRSRKDERAPGIGRLLFNTMSLVGGTMAICVAAALGLGILMLTLCMAASRC
jgi:FtsH-binding integral membrane protein